MSGKRRRPWMVRVTTGYEIDPVSGKHKQKTEILGYAATRSKITFREVYEQWSAIKYPTVSKSNIHGYEASYKVCGMLYDRIFKDIRLADLQHVVDTCGKNYPTLKKLKGLFNQLYEYAMKNDVCNKDYSEYVDIQRYKDRNPDKRDHNKFTREEVDRLWEFKDQPYYQIVLMLIYTGCRISELLALKKENVNLKECAVLRVLMVEYQRKMVNNVGKAV